MGLPSARGCCPGLLEAQPTCSSALFQLRWWRLLVMVSCSVDRAAAFCPTPISSSARFRAPSGLRAGAPPRKKRAIALGGACAPLTDWNRVIHGRARRLIQEWAPAPAYYARPPWMFPAFLRSGSHCGEMLACTQAFRIAIASSFESRNIATPARPLTALSQPELHL